MRTWFTPDVAEEGDTVTLSITVSRQQNTPDGSVDVEILLLEYLGVDDTACVGAHGHVVCPLPPAGTTRTIHITFRVEYVAPGTEEFGMPVEASNGDQTISQHPVVTLQNLSSEAPGTEWAAHYDTSTAEPGDLVKLSVSTSSFVDTIFYVSRAHMTLIKCTGGDNKCGYNTRYSSFTCQLPENGGLCVMFFRVTGCPHSGRITQQIALRNSDGLVLTKGGSVTLTCRTTARSPVSATSVGDLPTTGISLPLYGGSAGVLLAGGGGLLILARRRRTRTERD